jgi:hypothetical protein
MEMQPAADGGDVDVDAAGGDGTEGHMPTTSILARSRWNHASSPMIRRGDWNTQI